MLKRITKYSFLLTLILSLLACNFISQRTTFRTLNSPDNPATPTPEPHMAKIDRDVVYCRAGEVDLKMDVYQPPDVTRPTPAILYVHGGGWMDGDKSSDELGLVAPFLLAEGYFLASVNYRLAPAHPFPAQIEDVKCAVRYLRANAAHYNLDPARIGAAGGSAGGHLVSLLGLAGASAGWDVGPYRDQSSQVQAVVDLFGPADLLSLTDVGAYAQSLARQVFGVTREDDPALKKASPVNYITPAAPPFLIIQGEEDTLVPPSQSREFYQRLKQAGVPAHLIMVKNAGHALQPVGGKLAPSLADLTEAVVLFFNQYLKK